METIKLEKIFCDYNDKDSLIIFDGEPLFLSSCKNVFSSQNFFKYLYEKAPVLSNLEILNKTSSSFIIRSVSKELLKQNKALSNLVESITFSEKLYNLFGEFIKYDFSVEKLLHINTNTENLEDKKRLEVVFQIYSAYLEKLRVNNYIDV